MMEPFTAHIDEEDLDDVRRRLAATRWVGLAAAEDGDFRSIRRFAERDHARITSWTSLPGVTGHYSAHTNPDQLAADIRRFFRPLRPDTEEN